MTTSDGPTLVVSDDGNAVFSHFLASSTRICIFVSVGFCVVNSNHLRTLPPPTPRARA